jgi:hypothetical protein
MGVGEAASYFMDELINGMCSYDEIIWRKICTQDGWGLLLHTRLVTVT